MWVFICLFIFLIGGHWLLLRFFSRKNFVQDWFDKNHAKNEERRRKQKELNIVDRIQKSLHKAVKLNRVWGELLVVSRHRNLELYVQNDTECVLSVFVYSHVDLVRVKALFDGNSKELFIPFCDDQNLGILIQDMTTYLQNWMPKGISSTETVFD